MNVQCRVEGKQEYATELVTISHVEGLLEKVPDNAVANSRRRGSVLCLVTEDCNANLHGSWRNTR